MIDPILACLLIIFSVGVITLKKPVYSSLCFLGTLITLSTYYFEHAAEFIAAMQILVYAGAILVVFMFVMVLFQDAYQKIMITPPRSYYPLLFFAGASFLGALGFLITRTLGISIEPTSLPQGFGSVQNLGRTLYTDFFFPFEAVVALFLIASIGALYIGRKEL